MLDCLQFEKVSFLPSITLLLLALELKPEKLGKEFQGRNQQYGDQWFREVH